MVKLVSTYKKAAGILVGKLCTHCLHFREKNILYMNKINIDTSETSYIFFKKKPCKFFFAPWKFFWILANSAFLQYKRITKNLEEFSRVKDESKRFSKNTNVLSFWCIGLHHFFDGARAPLSQFRPAKMRMLRGKQKEARKFSKKNKALHHHHEKYSFQNHFQDRQRPMNKVRSELPFRIVNCATQVWMISDKISNHHF